MATTVKLRRIGNSLGVILPKELADQMQLAEGDTLHIIPDQDGARLTPYDPDFDDAMKAFARTRRKYKNALRTLAK
jgi:putative addiction module antidote